MRTVSIAQHQARLAGAVPRRYGASARRSRAGIVNHSKCRFGGTISQAPSGASLVLLAGSPLGLQLGRRGLAIVCMSAATGPNMGVPTSFTMLPITGDGACMFRAVVQGAQICNGGSPMNIHSEGQAALNLRTAVVEELRNRKSEIEPFLPGIATDFEKYLSMMSNPQVWGGEPEMLMASHVIKRAITVYHEVQGNLEPIVTYGDIYKGQAVHLLWRGNHYDLLVPAV